MKASRLEMQNSNSCLLLWKGGICQLYCPSVCASLWPSNLLSYLSYTSIFLTVLQSDVPILQTNIWKCHLLCLHKPRVKNIFKVIVISWSHASFISAISSNGANIDNMQVVFISLVHLLENQNKTYLLF